MLNSRAAEYLLVGGYAVNYYGYSRSTGDLDIWIASTPENAEAVTAALREFGFLSARVEVLTTPNQVIRMGVPPLRIKILTSISGVEFSECYGRRIPVDVDGLPAPVIRLDDLLVNKRAAGRAKDLADLEELQ